MLNRNDDHNVDAKMTHNVQSRRVKFRTRDVTVGVLLTALQLLQKVLIGLTDHYEGRHEATNRYSRKPLLCFAHIYGGSGCESGGR